jgi:hypothetical protein
LLRLENSHTRSDLKFLRCASHRDVAEKFGVRQYTVDVPEAGSVKELKKLLQQLVISTLIRKSSFRPINVRSNQSVNERQIQMSVRKMAKKIGCCPATAYHWMKEAVKNKMIYRKKVYTILSTGKTFRDYLFGLQKRLIPSWAKFARKVVYREGSSYSYLKGVIYYRDADAYSFIRPYVRKANLYEGEVLIIAEKFK